MRVNGIAHIILTVNDPARSVPFYERIFSFLEFTTVLKTEQGAYFVGGKTAVGIMPAAEEHRGSSVCVPTRGLTLTASINTYWRWARRSFIRRRRGRGRPATTRYCSRTR